MKLKLFILALLGALLFALPGPFGLGHVLLAFVGLTAVTALDAILHGTRPILGAIAGFVTANESAALKETLLFAFKTASDGTPEYKGMGINEVSSNDAYEEMVEYAGFGPAPVKEQMAQMAVDVVQQGYTKRITQVASAVMMPVSEEAIRFQKYKEAIDAAGSIAESLRLRVEYLVSDMFGNAFDATNFAGPDGASLCSLTHKLIRGGTFSNRMATDASLSETALETITVQCRKMPGSHGHPVGVQPRRVIGPPDLEWEAKRILNSAQQNDTMNNAINAIKGEGMVWKGNRFLPSSTNWFVGTSAPKSLYIIWTKKAEFRDYEVNAQRAKVFDGYQMLGVDWVDPRGLIGSNI
jgi:hypothetical protein